MAKFIARELSGAAELTGLYDIDPLKSKKLAQGIAPKKNLAQNTLGQLIRKADLVIEAAKADKSWPIAKSALLKGRSVMIMSVGGIIDHFQELSSLAKKHNARVYIPSGAICGIDALKAARLKGIKQVTLTTRKHPFSFRGVPYVEKKGIDLKRIKRDRLLFSGSAKKAVKYFPQNINVAAILSIAGIGENKTRVRIIASPKVKQNIHEVEIFSGAAKVFTRTENILHPQNPKTSYLAVLSAMAVLRQVLEPVRIGT